MGDKSSKKTFKMATSVYTMYLTSLSHEECLKKGHSRRKEEEESHSVSGRVMEPGGSSLTLATEVGLLLEL